MEQGAVALFFRSHGFLFPIALFFETTNFIGQLPLKFFDFSMLASGFGLFHFLPQQQFLGGNVGLAFGFDGGNTGLLFVCQPGSGRLRFEAGHCNFVGGFHDAKFRRMPAISQQRLDAAWRIR